MPEIDFLPDWYTQALRRNQRVAMQFWLTITVVAAVVTWAIFTASSIYAGEHAYSQIQAQLDESAQRVKEREQQKALREKLLIRERVDNSLGLHVEGSRLLNMLDNCTPISIAYSELAITTNERPMTLSEQASAKIQDRELALDRHIEVNLKGVAPTSIEVARLLENLTNAGIASDIKLNYTRDAVQDGHEVCEFEMDFRVNLNAGGGR